MGLLNLILKAHVLYYFEISLPKKKKQEEEGCYHQYVLQIKTGVEWM